MSLIDIMDIIVLDGYTLNPGDLKWDSLKKLGNCLIYRRTEPEDIINRAKDAEILLTKKVTITRSIIAQLRKLKYIGILATGYEIVDLVTARDRNIIVTNILKYATHSVAQMVFAHLLNLTQHVAYYNKTIQNGVWNSSKDFCYWDYPLIELTGLTIGIIGFGHIGVAVSNLATAFGMKVIVYSQSMNSLVPNSVAFVDLETLLKTSDVVSLHCRLTENNRGFVNKCFLSQMKKTAFLINTSRGALVDEQALAEALNKGVIAGAGLDVLAKEPPTPTNPLLNAKNCFITPHIAWTPVSARQRLLNIAIENIQAFMNGKPQNVVNM